ncbi:2-amino-4-hydroxy-6-hydroxymethyldihydropteridine diphosphokinase [Bacillus sp. USDA818B3_A]|uniref:2-amino-4-hydroxy-6- hydroxymethyldihydropteridine diphosphokinase n=1 Tax=Bacillus sp. USDA818B3_A TaxID=2698834 RepID=UPI00136ECFC4|nr:2-amino-4-hydroxy-6-hydroxymethyldihydropteridine diphosphokinase [Bacillus sp. USDA818B3_A]
MENTAYISLGSNIGNRYDNIVNAINQLIGYSTVKVVNFSSIYETDPVGYEDQDLFLNMVIKVQTSLTAMELLDTCLNIEKELGRKREIKWGPRTIDLDILTFNQENIESEKLTVPHPRMIERSFVVVPLVEIDQNLRLPGVDKPLNIIVNELPDKEGVRLWKRKNGEDVFEPFES